MSQFITLDTNLIRIITLLFYMRALQSEHGDNFKFYIQNIESYVESDNFEKFKFQG